MKNLKPLALAAALSIGGWAGGASAQSSVTVGGVIDSAVRSVSNARAGNVTSVVSGSSATSRLIFRGTEDLGGGLSASFHLEHGLAVDSGAASGGTQFWDRRATLSLASRSLGEVRLGRDYVPTYTLWVRQDPFSHVGVAGSTNLYTATPQGPIRSTFGTAANTLVRSSNAVQYLLPGGLGGVEGGVMVALAEGGTQAGGANKVTGGRLGYAAGPLFVALAYMKSENDVTAVTGDLTDTVLAASYDFGVARVGLTQRSFKQALARQTLRMLSTWVPLGQGELKFQYLQSNMDGRVGNTVVSANDAKQLGLGYVYNLSKRTALYAQVARVSNSGTATYAVPGGPAVAGGGRTSTGYELGIRHSF